MATLVYSLADKVRLFFRAGRALGVYGSMMLMMNLTEDAWTKCEKTVRYVAVYFVSLHQERAAQLNSSSNFLVRYPSSPCSQGSSGRTFGNPEFGV